MKKLNLFALALLFVGAIACQNAESNESEAEEAVEEVGEDMEDAGDDIEEGARK
ncbi:MAG: hypothetical protein U5L96_16340 [Owenweeksia sp.]|nr:hypothetical protein [Owenweeksia sp.]